MKNTFHNHGGGPFGTTTMNCSCGDPNGPHPSLTKFGEKTLEEIAQETVKRCQKTSVAVYLATEEGPASDISECLKEAAEVINLQDQMIKAIQKVHDDEPENIETLEDVIKQLKHHRQTHVRWVEWYFSYPNDNEHEYAGDSEHHIHIINRYDKMIELIDSIGRSSNVA